MSSRLFQTIREQRGLAYAVFSGMSSYRDTGMLSVYAGCAAESVPEVVELVGQELRAMRTEAVGDEELRRAKDHLKGSLMLSLESTSSRMTHLARQEMYFGRHVTLDEIIAGIEQRHGRRRAARGRRVVHAGRRRRDGAGAGRAGRARLHAARGGLTPAPARRHGSRQTTR